MMKAVAVVASLLVALLAAELLLHVIGYRYSPLTIVDRGGGGGGKVGGGDFRHRHAFEDDHFVFDPRLIWRPRAGATPFNELGYRGRVVSRQKPKGQLRVLVVGDSNTLGHAGRGGANWPLGLERHDSRLTVLNGGVYGYTSFQGVRRLQQMISFSPDMVLISFGSNDAHVVRTSDATYAEQLASSGGGERWYQGLRLWDLWRALSERFRRHPKDKRLTHRVPLERYRANLRRMVAIARRAGAQPVLLTRPFIGHSSSPLWWKSHGPRYNAATLEIARELKVPAIDVYEQFARAPELFADESHFTAEGHRRAAALIYQRIKPLLGAHSR